MPTRLLVAVDLSTEAPPELAFAQRLAAALSAEIVLLHVVDYVPTVMPVELPAGYVMPQFELVREAVAKKLERIASKSGHAKVRTLVVHGTPAATIVDVALRENVDQIIVGSHRHGAVSRLVLGSVADRVAHTADRPVTIVRGPKR